MALPKRRHSHSRTRKRRAPQKISLPSLVKCPSCGALKRPYTVCAECGYYNGRQVFEVEKKKKKKKK